jgi:predicted AAA+ superfamily ATPase
LWLGFHNVDQDGYLDMVLGYAEHLGFALEPDELKRRALNGRFSVARGLAEQHGNSFKACLRSRSTLR